MLRNSAAALLAVILIPSAFAQTCSRTYIVQSGDTCDTISATNNVSTYQLVCLNSAINAECSNLYVSQMLCLGLEAADCIDNHVVATDDTCCSIAAAYGISVTVLYENNPNINAACDNIYPGEVLCVAPDVVVLSECSATASLI